MQLRAHSRECAQRRGRAGEDADQLGDGAAGRGDALQEPLAAGRRGQLVVDVEAGVIGLYGHGELQVFCGLDAYRLFIEPLLYF